MSVDRTGYAKNGARFPGFGHLVAAKTHAMLYQYTSLGQVSYY